MQFTAALTFLFALTTPVLAHFKLNIPTSRGDIDDSEINSPCGGVSPSKTRSKWNVKGGELQITAGHDQANMAVYLALDNNDPAAKDFNYTIAPEFLQIGLGVFCWNDLTIPSDVESHIKDGMNATIQVVQQSADYPSGLYNCADITFTTDEVSTSTCKNGTGVSASSAKTVPSASASASSSSSSSSNSSGTASSTAAPAATSSSAATILQVAGGAALGGALAVGAILL